MCLIGLLGKGFLAGLRWIKTLFTSSNGALSVNQDVPNYESNTGDQRKATSYYPFSGFR